MGVFCCLGFIYLPNHEWLYLVPYKMPASGELTKELKYSCHSWSEIVVSSAADLVVFFTCVDFLLKCLRVSTRVHYDFCV